MWTQFSDMHSGGGLKEKQSDIFIEAPEAEAKSVFYERLGHSPDRISCTCCGEDYSTGEYPTLELATAYERGCGVENGEYVERHGEHSYRPYTTLVDYIAQENVLVIRAEEITDYERTVDVPEEGYVWR